MPTSASRQVFAEYKNWTQGPQFQNNNRAGVGGDGYTCVNMQVYSDGSLGIAPGLKDWGDESGLFGSNVDAQAQLVWHPRVNDYKGQLWGLGLFGGASSDIYFFDFATNAWTLHASSSALGIVWNNWKDTSPGQWTSQNSTLNPTWTPRQGGGVQHVLALDDRILAAEVRVNAAGTASALGWTETPRMANWVEYRGRIYAWKGAGGTRSSRVWYSDIDNYMLQTSSNQFFDVGINNNTVYIKGAWALRDSILFCLSNNDWYAYSGVPGAAQLRFIGRYVGPAHQAAGAVLGNELYFISPTTLSPCVATPQGVDSTTFSYARNAGFVSRFPGRTVVSTERNAVHCVFNIAEIPATSSSFGFLYTELVNGVWVPGDLQDADGRSIVDTCTVGNGEAYAYLYRGPTGRAVLRTRNVVLNRPAATSDLWSQPRAGSTGQVTLAPFTPEPGNEARVKSVAVDVRYWKTTGYNNPAIGVTGLVYGGTLSSTWPNGTGVPRRLVFREDVQTGTFSARPQVQMTGIDSLTIDRVIVEYEVRPVNNWLGQTGGV